MNRPHPIERIFATSLVLWLVSVGCTLFATFTVGINPADGLAVQHSLLAVFTAVAAVGADIAGWRACRALDYSVRTVR